MTSTALRSRLAVGGRAPAWIAYGTSVVLHAAVFVAIYRLPAIPVEHQAAPVSVEIIEAPRPAPAPPPAPAPARPASNPRLIRSPLTPVAPSERPPPRTSAPPPTSAPAAPSSPGQPRIGVSMSSTSTAGSYAAPVGNTSLGKAPRVAPDPSEVKPSRAELAPATEVSSLPVPLRVDLPKSEYPPDAQRDGFEGVVKLRLVVDEEGNVREATVVSDPGRGLGAAAVRAAKRWFKFRPARKDGVAVATEIPFTVEFQLQ